MKNAEKYLLLFLFGGAVYGLIEVSFRGYTHWSMIITGGSAVLALFIINEAMRASIFIKALVGTAVITTLEFTVGIIVNKVFNLGVWDYTNLPDNFMGQISLTFSLCWYGLSITAFILFDILKRIIHSQKRDTPLLREMQQKQ